MSPPTHTYGCPAIGTVTRVGDTRRPAAVAIHVYTVLQLDRETGDVEEKVDAGVSGGFVFVFAVWQFAVCS